VKHDTQKHGEKRTQNTQKMQAFRKEKMLRSGGKSAAVRKTSARRTSTKTSKL